jgi:hypothetical protein
MTGTVYEITAPDGKTYEITAPEGASKEQALEFAKTQLEGRGPGPVSAGDRIKALQGGLYRGAVAGTLGLPMDTVQNVYNLGKAAIGTVAGMVGRPDLMPEPTSGTPLSSEWIANQMQRVGINTQNPRPDDPTSRRLYTGGTIGGALSVPMGGIPKASQVLPAVAGGVIGSEVSDNPLAPVLGTMLPGAARQAGAEIKTKIAGKDIGKNLTEFDKAGAPLSLGQATENRFLDGLENVLSKIPGGYGIFQKFVKEQQASLSPEVKEPRGKEASGRAIEYGVTGKDGFLDRTKATWNKLDADVASKIPKDAEVAPTNTLKVLQDLTTPVAGAEKTSRVLTNPKLQEIYDAFKSDMAVPELPLPGREVPAVLRTIDKNVIEQPQSNIQKTIETAATELHPHGFGEPSPKVSFPQTNASGKSTMPYQALRVLRTKVGAMLDDSLTSGVPNGELKKLYGALSEDIKIAAEEAGPAALKAFNRQNDYWSARQQRLDSTLTRVIGNNKAPEDIYNAAISGTSEGATKIRAIMRSLNPAEREIITNTVVDKLGHARPGKQTAEGDVFSTENFLTNYVKMSPQAKQQLFSDPTLKADLDNLAQIASNIREGSKVFQNPGGTAGALFVYGLGSTAIAGFMTGNVPAVLWPATVYVGALGMSKLMTNQSFVHWMAEIPKMQTETQAAAHLARLSVLFNKSDENTKEHIAKFVDGFNQSRQVK